jgi:hypothetical protein
VTRPPPATRSLATLFLLVLLPLAVACGTGNGGRLRVGSEDGRADAGGGGGLLPGVPDGGALDASDTELRVRIRDPQALSIELVTLRCAGDCAEVIAAASGGNPPYVFAWDDGSADPQHQVCAEQDSTFAVTVTDTAVTDGEFTYEAQRANAELRAQVLACADAGAPAACTGADVEPPPPGHYVGTMECPAATSSGGASGATGTVMIDIAPDGTGSVYFQWSLVVIGAQGTFTEADCLDGDFHAAWSGVWGVPGAADPNQPDKPPPVLPTSTITGTFTAREGATAGEINGEFHWDAEPFLDRPASICHGTFTAQLQP